MAKHLLFLLHGMGRHPAGWSRQAGSVVQTLTTEAKRYRFFQTRELEDFVEFAELEYDSVFERWRTSVAANAAAVVAAAPDAWARNLLGSMAALGPGGPDNFAVSHCLDVALYRLLPNVHNEVLAHLHAQILPRLVPSGAGRVSVLTHSLGTAVGHDAFAKLCTDGTPDTNPWHVDNPSPDRFQLRSYFTLANVSRVLQTNPKALDSPIRPGTASQRPCFVRRFVNAVHGLDPFPRVKRFHPLPDWQNESYLEIQVDHLLDPNVHGYEHYLRHPKVHSVILNRLMFKEQIAQEEVATQLDTTLRAAQEAALADAALGIGMRVPELTDLLARIAPAVDDAPTEFGVETFLQTIRDYF